MIKRNAVLGYELRNLARRRMERSTYVVGVTLAGVPFGGVSSIRAEFQTPQTTSWLFTNPALGASWSSEESERFFEFRGESLG
jgi:hypothetical protein